MITGNYLVIYKNDGDTHSKTSILKHIENKHFSVMLKSSKIEFILFSQIIEVISLSHEPFYNFLKQYQYKKESDEYINHLGVRYTLDSLLIQFYL